MLPSKYPPKQWQGTLRAVGIKALKAEFSLETSILLVYFSSLVSPLALWCLQQSVVHPGFHPS